MYNIVASSHRSSKNTVATTPLAAPGRVWLAAALLLGCGSSGPTNSIDQVPPQVAQDFQSALERQSSNNLVIGAQATVMIPGVGQWTGVYGQSGDSTPMEKELLVPVGSVGKSVISGLVLRLVDLGYLSLDDTVGELLPSFPNVTPEATVAQILSNSSGIASYSSWPGYIDTIAADLDREWDRADIIRRFVGFREFEPGTSWKSSNTGYMLAEMIAESVTGEDLIDLYREHLYEPLGLGGITIVGAEEPHAPRAVTWTGPAGGPFQNFNETYDGRSFQTGFGFVGVTVFNSMTLARWGQALFGRDFLSDETRAAMLTAIPDDGRIPGQTGASLGVRRFGYFDRTQWGHSGTVFNGSAFVLWDVESDIVVALVYNQSGASHSQSHFALMQALLKRALQEVGSS